jgi:hypothetical protein
MGSVAIEPLNASSQATGNTTLVICRKAHVFRVCSRVSWSEPYIASFKGFYCLNPVTRTSMIIAFKGKGLIKEFIIIVMTSRVLTSGL